MTPRSETVLLTQGQHASGSNFFHILLPTLEADASHLLSVLGDKATLHRILATGEVISTDLGLPVVRAVVSALDSFVTQ